ncbi:MAG: hypothetical protein WC506_06510 [Candidatus Micrarchaeia archaeon]
MYYVLMDKKPIKGGGTKYIPEAKGRFFSKQMDMIDMLQAKGSLTAKERLAMAMAYQRLGSYGLAAGDYEIAFSLSQPTGKQAANAALCLWQMDDYDGARRLLEGYSISNKADHLPFFILGMMDFHSHRHKEAAKMFDKAFGLARAAKNQAAMATCAKYAGQAYFYSGSLPEALSFLALFVEYRPRELDVKLSLATCKLMMGFANEDDSKFFDSQNGLLEILGAHPDSEEAYFLLSMSKLALGSPTGVAFMEELLRKSDDDALKSLACLNLGVFHFKQEDYDASARYLIRAMKYHDAFRPYIQKYYAELIHKTEGRNAAGGEPSGSS